MKKNSRKNKKSSSKNRFAEGAVKRYFMFLGLAGLGLAAFGSLLIVGMFLYYSYGTELPSVDELKNYHPEESIKVTDRNGKLIANIGDQIRTMVPIDKIPRILIKAVVSAEDASFFHHDGLNYPGMMRAFWINLMARRYKQGGSTITQQVVKRLLLSPKRTLKRKFQEVILARRLESALSKEEILHIYLNEIYYGHKRYGAEEASLFFFNKHVWDIDILEAALLAGIPQSPEYNSPIKHPEKAKKRTAYVLKQMHKHGFITDAEYKSALKRGLPAISAKHSAYNEAAAEITDAVKAKLKSGELKVKGGKIVTTMDLKLQKIVKSALLKGLKTVDRRQKVTKLRHLSVSERAKHLSKLKKNRNKNYGGILEGVVTGRTKGKLVVDLGFSKGLVVSGMKRYYPAGYSFNPPIEKKRTKRRKKRKKNKKSLPAIRTGDLFRVRIMTGQTKLKEAPLRLKAELGPQGVAVVLSVKNRDILAMAGGVPFKNGDFNRALRSLRQPGSSFKPFVYATAINSGKYSAASIFNDSPEVYKKWMPRSHGYMGPVTLRTALAHSLNTVAVQLLRKTGINKVRSLAQRAGISTKLARNLSLALGSSEVHPLEIINAYGIFPSGGIARAPRLVLKAGDTEIPPSKPVRVLKSNAAWIMTSMLRSVVNSGTATRVRKLKRPVAGKTGTTNKARDAWFIGFTPNYICGVWVGYDDRKPLGRHEEGGKTAAPVFLNIMKTFLSGKPVSDFLMVPGLIVKYINPKTGKVVPSAVSGAVKEYFMPGTVPETEQTEERDLNSQSLKHNENSDDAEDAGAVLIQ